MRFINKLDIDFIGKRYLYFASTLALIIAGIAVFVIKKGPILSIEFTGGSLVQVSFKEMPPVEDIRQALDKDGWKGYTLQSQRSSNAVLLRLKTSEKSKEDISADVMTSLKKFFPGNVSDKPDRVEFIGSVIGKSIIWNTFFALLGSFVLIIIYVGFRFKNLTWGFAGVFALMHDVFIVWAVLTFLNAETTLVVIAALLTLAGYSINDTIVIFDRVRENLRTARKEDTKVIYNRSLNETMSRTINTALTVFISSLILLVLGGDVLRDFSLAFTIGVLLGTYSSVGVALSMVYEIENWRKKKVA